MLNHIKHSIVSLQIAKNMANPMNGVYNGPISSDFMAKPPEEDNNDAPNTSMASSNNTDSPNDNDAIVGKSSDLEENNAQTGKSSSLFLNFSLN